MSDYSAGLRISLVLPTLGMGGAEKNRVKLANMLVDMGYEVDLVVRYSTGHLHAFLDSRVVVHDLQARRVRYSVVPLFKYLRSRRPDAVLVAMWPLTVVSTLVVKISGIGARVVLSEHTTLSKTPYAIGQIKGQFLRLTVGLVYRLADAIVAVSEGVADDLYEVSLPRLPRGKIAVVYNSAERFAPAGSIGAEGSRAPSEHGSVSRFVAVGNLKPAKDYATLLRAFKLVLESHRAILKIVGDGPLAEELAVLTANLGLSDHVQFMGYMQDPDRIVSDSDVLVLSSRWEGFPNVLVEALRLGKQVVSTNCRSGPAEILDDGKYGWLSPVSDFELLAHNMKCAITTPIDVTTLLEGAARYSDKSFLSGYIAAIRGISV